MSRINRFAAAMALAVAVPVSSAAAQSGHPRLHVNPRWKQCSIQLDPSLTQDAWRQFTQEAGLVAYFRPVADAAPIGRGHLEVSVLQWGTGIDDEDAAWNDTFVHPDSTHWLTEGSGLQFPGLMLRAGVSSKTDVNFYFTKNVSANYGFYGVQVQRQVLGSASSPWAVSGRASVVRLFGPADVNFSVGGVDAVASRRFLLRRWASLSPYAGVSTYLTASHEKSPLVVLRDERVAGAQAMAGAALQLSRARIALEYNASRVNTISMKVGYGT